MTTAAGPHHRIELRLRELSQFFNSMDPTPFYHKDLDPDAEAFIESWALEFPPDSRLAITVHLESWPPTGDPTPLVTEALQYHFSEKARLARHELHTLLRQGRTSLAIGLSFLVACLLMAEALSAAVSGTFLAVLRESLTIAGWVAMWRPIQIFLYDWWPIARRARVYRNIGNAHVRVLRGTGSPA